MKINESKMAQELLDRISTNLECEKMCWQINFDGADKVDNEQKKEKYGAALAALNNMDGVLELIAAAYNLRYPHLPERSLKLVKK